MLFFVFFGILSYHPRLHKDAIKLEMVFLTNTCTLAAISVEVVLIAHLENVSVVLLLAVK